MKTTHTFGIQFIMRLNKKDRTKGIIYVRITVDSKIAEISLKKTLQVNNWNAAKGKAKGSGIESKNLNKYLDDIHVRLTECYRELQLNQEIISPETIKALFLGDNPNQNTLTDLVNYHNHSQFPVLSKNTQKNYRVTKKYILLFLNQNQKVSDIYLAKLDYKFITDFDYFLRTYKRSETSSPLRNNGVMKHLQRLRKILDLGVRLEWLEKNPFNAYKIKFERVERGFLNENELNKLEKENIKIERLQTIKDLFIFSCYTGLAYIDTINLVPSDISMGIDRQKWIFTKREKTQTLLKIPILPKALEIIEKYKKNPKSIQRGAIFPMISNQKLNCYLKEVADLCGIEKNLTFHLARHTFATTVTLSNGVPIETVSNLLGHKSISTTQIYAKVLENKVSKDMAKLKGKLSEGKSKIKKSRGVKKISNG